MPGLAFKGGRDRGRCASRGALRGSAVYLEGRPGVLKLTNAIPTHDKLHSSDFSSFLQRLSRFRLPGARADGTTHSRCRPARVTGNRESNPLANHRGPRRPNAINCGGPPTRRSRFGGSLARRVRRSSCAPPSVRPARPRLRVVHRARLFRTACGGKRLPVRGRGKIAAFPGGSEQFFRRHFVIKKKKQMAKCRVFFFYVVDLFFRSE